ncbi:MAG: hypothetical protein V7K69_24470 [Nostoc sp.]
MQILNCDLIMHYILSKPKVNNANIRPFFYLQEIFGQSLQEIAIA